MAAGPPGQWASVIFVAAQVHTRVRFLFLSFSISLTFFFISTYFRYSHFFLLQKKKYIYIIFPLKFFSANISFFSLLFLLNTFFFLYLTMIFLSLILLISTFFLYLHLCFLRLTIPPLHTKCYGRGFLTPCHEGEGEGEMVAWPS